MQENLLFSTVILGSVFSELLHLLLGYQFHFVISNHNQSSKLVFHDYNLAFILTVAVLQPWLIQH